MSLIDCSGASPRCRDRGYVVDLTNRERPCACCHFVASGKSLLSHEANCAGREDHGRMEEPAEGTSSKRTVPAAVDAALGAAAMATSVAVSVTRHFARAAAPSGRVVITPSPSWPNACIRPASSRPSPTAAMRRGHPRVATSTG